MFKGGGFHINDYAPKAPCGDDCACSPPKKDD
jgi:hypothetical protein